MKVRPVGADLFHTDRHDEANSRFFVILRTRLKNVTERAQHFGLLS